MSDSDEIQPEHLPMEFRGEHIPAHEDVEISGLKVILEQIEQQYLNTYYQKYPNIRDAAKHLKMAPTTFLRRRTQLNEKYQGWAIHFIFEDYQKNRENTHAQNFSEFSQRLNDKLPLNPKKGQKEELDFDKIPQGFNDKVNLPPTIPPN